MKKILLSVAALTMLFGATLLTSCSKDDTTAPVITLKGDNPMPVTLNGTYTEPGATANDNKDGDLTSSIVTSGTVNVNLKGAYTITYTVSDAAGNTGTATRTVNVVNSAEFLAGNYNVSDMVTGDTTGTWTFNVTVATSSITNGSFTINNFGGFGSTVAVAASVSGTVITIASQTPSGLAATIQGTGTANTSSIIATATTADFGGGAVENDNCSYTKAKK